MQILLEVFEATSTATFVSGFLLNLLLLYLIHRFSTKELGTYKYLLEIFAAYDTYLVVVHHVVNPKVIPSRTGFSFVSDRDFGVFELTCFYSSCYSAPFAILNIHLLYRYWTIHAPHKIALFSKPKFIALLSTAVIFVQIGMFYACYFLASPEDLNEIRHYQSLFRAQYERDINEGALILNYWKDDGELSMRPLMLLVVADSLQFCTFTVAAILAIKTYREIRTARHISEKIRDFQLQVLIAAIAQTLTPVIFVYTPYFLNVNFPIFHIHYPPYSILSMLLFSLYPLIDAIVIISLMKPYREGLLRLLRRREEQAVVIISSAFTGSVSNASNYS